MPFGNQKKWVLYLILKSSKCQIYHETPSETLKVTTQAKSLACTTPHPVRFCVPFPKGLLQQLPLSVLHLTLPFLSASLSPLSRTFICSFS